jgi:hypothetical protein
MGKEYCSIERKDYVAQTNPGGRGLHQSSHQISQVTQGSVFDGGSFLYQQDPIFLDIQSQYLFHGH